MSTSPARILIVDDKEENLCYLQALFAGHGYAPDTARHGAEALFKARQNPPALIVSDLLMPVMDGYTLLRHWKSDGVLRSIPFIVYTATYTEAEDERLALSLGADAFILKPAEPEDFLARMRELLAGGPRGESRPPALQAPADEQAMLKVYSETLIRKLEEKTLQLEQTNRNLEQDIAERRRAEERLRESEERFRATFEQAAVGLAHVGLDGRLLRVNAKLCAITGYPLEELLERHVADLIAPEDRAALEEGGRALLAGTRTVDASEKRCVHRNDGLFWGSIVTTLLRDEAGAPKYFISVIADITERRMHQEQFLRSQRMESIGTLAGGIAHDLNNLLAPIIMGLGLLRLHQPDEKTRGVIDTIEQSARRGTELVKQVLTFARGVESPHAPVPVADLLRELDVIFCNSLPGTITYETGIAPDVRPLLGDSTQLNQVLLNLCVNARDAMPQGGRLTLSARNVEVDEQAAAMRGGLDPGHYVMLEVKDTGTGMSREVLDRIFDPFFSTKLPGKGTGLGLPTARGIVRNHGGSIGVESQPGKGSVFQVLIPAHVAAAEATAKPSARPGPPRGSGEVILVADDDATVLDITRQTLETFGYRVVTAEDGAQAMAQYAMNPAGIALVLTDMTMPVMDGAALIIALRRLNPDVRIIGTTGFGADADNIRRRELNIPHFLTKPYPAAVLLDTVHTALHSPARTASA
ncbi:MAG: response regulator [Opitutaceae bacterium]|nr:response regulator [Opitutaceae bacterium]